MPDSAPHKPGPAGEDGRQRPYNGHMYIIAIGWLWVALMMAITERNLVAGILSFVSYGLLPCLLLLWLLGTPARRQRRAEADARNSPPDEDKPQ